MPTKVTSLASLTSATTTNFGPSSIFAARVRFAIVDNKTNSNLFNDFGEWSSIGCIFFDLINNPNPDPEVDTNSFARPLFPNNSNIPLKNEIVYVVGFPSAGIQSNVNEISYYYFQAVIFGIVLTIMQFQILLILLLYPNLNNKTIHKLKLVL